MAGGFMRMHVPIIPRTGDQRQHARHSPRRHEGRITTMEHARVQDAVIILGGSTIITTTRTARPPRRQGRRWRAVGSLDCPRAQPHHRPQRADAVPAVSRRVLGRGGPDARGDQQARAVIKGAACQVRDVVVAEDAVLGPVAPNVCVQLPKGEFGVWAWFGESQGAARACST